MTNNDRRLIEDYLPIEAISKEASREKSVRKGHISTLHLWWARRPLVACRAAVYGALVPASQFVPNNGPDNKKQSLGRANAAKFVERLCKYPGDPRVIQQAQEHILEAHAKRLTAELAEAAETGRWPGWVDEFKWPKDKPTVTRADIEAGRAPRPRVLDMFAGGGAIPLEALRLGCEAYALDLNPVAHIIELCTLVYPQKYGKPDPNARGMTGPPGPDGKPTWGGLAEEVRYWGQWVLREVKKEIGDLYPPVPDPDYLSACGHAQAGKGKRPEIEFDRKTGNWVVKGAKGKDKDALFETKGGAPAVPPGYLMPVAYLWTRTVRCKNPACGATVPLVKQTWLCKKKPGKKSPGRYVALRMVTPRGEKKVRFEIVQATSEKGLGFDPSAFSKGGNATCPFCGTVAEGDHVKSEGCAGRLGRQIMCVVCLRPGERRKKYVSAGSQFVLPPDDAHVRERTASICASTGITLPHERIVNDAKNALFCVLYGLLEWGDIFIERQLCTLVSFVSLLRSAKREIDSLALNNHVTEALLACLALWVDKIVEYGSATCRWISQTEAVASTFDANDLRMRWDFPELNPFGSAGMNAAAALENIVEALTGLSTILLTGQTVRGSALNLPWGTEHIDAVITDPPYYDNVPYADISDFFYVWLRRSIGDFFSEHFASLGTPKKSEAVADATRHGGSKVKAKRAYELMMAGAFAQAHMTLKPEGILAVVYAHKTTMGWATLVDALRQGKFVVAEAWPLNTERSGRMRAQESSALASSIFLVARKRTGSETGSYERDVQPELQQIVRERVETLWKQGISGADLLIACVGAGLRAFTRFARVEYANGEEVPAERFLAEVETVVLETILARLSKEIGGNGGRRTSLSGVDPATRFYLLWRYTYRWTELDAGEAIVFANGTGVELDGPGSLSYGSRPLVKKKKGKYRLLDFTERGGDEKLGLPHDLPAATGAAQAGGQPAPLIDALHRVLWLMENRPLELPEFLRESRVNREQMRLVAQALAGPALKGPSEAGQASGELIQVSRGSELAALAKLTANWRAVVEDAALTPLEREARRTGQRILFDKETDT